MRKDKEYLTGTLLVFALVLVGCQPASDNLAAQPLPAKQTTGPTPASIAPADATLILGNENAPVTIVEFSDYQCPFCAQYTSETWPLLKAEFIDTGRVRYVFKDFPLTNIHPQAPRVHEAARCAGEQGAYWAMHDRLFVGQAKWASGSDHITVLKRYAADLGLETATFNACLDSGRWAGAVATDLAEGTSLGVRGTPTFFINGYPLVGAHPYKTFQFAISMAEQGKLREAYEPAP